MKAKIHPNYVKTTITCSGCNTTFESHSTVETMQVDVCSNCHPFYTGKQKLVDTAGRVDRFKARAKAAESKKDALTTKAQKSLKRQKAAAAATEQKAKSTTKTDDK